MAQMETPGVDIVEDKARTNSIVEVPTAIPAFIGITEMAQNGADSLVGKPWKITSMAEFKQYFGGAPVPKFMFSIKDNEADPKAFLSIPSPDKTKFLQVMPPDILFSFFYNMIMFFANGGGKCYIVSAGTYGQGKPIDKDKVAMALKALENEREVTMVVVPEAASSEDCKEIQSQLLAHCGKMNNRIAILDMQLIIRGDRETCCDVEKFRADIGEGFLSYGVAYHPWLNTSVLSDNDIDGTILTWDYSAGAPDLSPFLIGGSKHLDYFKTMFSDIKSREEKSTVMTDCTRDEIEAVKNDLHKALLQTLVGYQYSADKIKNRLNMLPPSAAMAGIYTMVDNTRGVWKAPANVSVNQVDSPTESIDNVMQEDLNFPMNGKAVNAIRTFTGEGIKVWGARTLDGNSQDWRYINVRRTMIFLEESVKKVVEAFACEPNDAATWADVKSMIESFLRSVWKRGGLAGATPEDAYEIHVELGDTMTKDDVLEGIMRVTVLVAILRPAEFMEITFQQQVQKSKK